MLIETLFVLAVTSAPVVHGSAVFDPPNPERWELESPEESPSSATCFDETRLGALRCSYRHRGVARRLGYALRRHLSLDDRLNGRTYLLVDVQPLVCSGEELMERSSSWMREKAALLWRGDELLEVDEGERLRLGSSRTRRLAFAVTDHDSVWIDLHVPTGVRRADAEDFDALVASIRSVQRPHVAYRRAALLERLIDRPPRPIGPTCRPPEEERVRLIAEELERATIEDPSDWRPWVELARRAERRLDVRAWKHFEWSMDHGLLGLEKSDVWYPAIPSAAPPKRDPSQLREVARLYGEAARRCPPALDGWPGGDLGAQDLAGVLAWQARHLAEANDIEDASQHYQRAVDEGTFGSWGVLEASLWLGERAYQSGDGVAALQHYSRARKAWESYWPRSRFLTDQIRTFDVIRLRLRELEADEGLRLPR